MGPAELQDTMQERSRIIVMALRIKPGSPPDVKYGIRVVWQSNVNDVHSFFFY